jgi:hypothetical protein
MAKARTLVGLDVHATKIVAAVLDAESAIVERRAVTAARQQHHPMSMISALSMPWR